MMTNVRSTYYCNIRQVKVSKDDDDADDDDADEDDDDAEDDDDDGDDEGHCEGRD